MISDVAKDSIKTFLKKKKNTRVFDQECNILKLLNHIFPFIGTIFKVQSFDA